MQMPGQMPMMFNPYGGMIGDPYQHDNSAQMARFQQVLAEEERKRREQEQQNNSSSQNMGEQLKEQMMQSQTGGMASSPDPFSITGAQGQPAYTGVNTLGGGQMGGAAPINMTTAGTAGMAQPAAFSIAGAPGVAAPAATTGVSTMGGGAIPMGMAGYGAPASAFTIGGAPVGAGAAVGAPVGAAAPATAGMAAGAGGAGAGAGAGMGAGAGSAAAGAGMGALGMAGMIAAPVGLGLAAANWANNTHDDVTWGTHLTNPSKGSGAVAENIDTKIKSALGDNEFSGGLADFVNSPQKLIAPNSPGEWVEGVGDALLINQTNDLLSGVGDWLKDLF